MEQKREICVVIGSAPIEEDPFGLLGRDGCFVICADGGYDTAVRFGIRPDLLIGDFDSVRGSLPSGVETIRLKVEKDDTDLLAAVKEGIRRGFRSFVLTGVLGGERFDHSFANICVLQYLCAQGCKAFIGQDRCQVFLLRSGRLTLSGEKGGIVSVFPFGCASCEVSYTGLQYPLTHAMLTSEVPLGVSNHIVEDLAQIVVHSGYALIVVQR